MAGFKVDVILSTLKELQKEKCRNEKVLAEEYAKRRNLEVQLQAINSKLQTTAHMNSKMKETLQVTCLKVDQSQAQAQMFEQLNGERREKITKLNSQIAGMDQVRQQNMKSYGSQMTTLTERFRSAWYDQGDDALDVKLHHIKKDKDDCRAKISENRTALDELVKELETVAADKSKNQVLEVLGGIHIETWKATLAMFDSENEAAKMAAEKRQDEEIKVMVSLENKRAELMKSLVREEPQNHEE